MSKVHMIGNAHLDPVWLWRWQEGYAEALATFRSALDRMNQFDDFVFTCAGAAYYEWVEQTDPGMFEEIRARVDEGRWVIVGGWWIQPDCNAPSGESFVRHSLYGQGYFMSRFGRRARVGYNVDSFGHNAMLPQILTLSGMDSYVYMRPDANREKSYPFDDFAFMWRSPDGSEVCAFHILDGYGSDPFDHAAEKARAALDMAERAGRPAMCFYGVGNHGGGPTIKNIDAIHGEQERPGGSEIVFSSPDAYFSQLKREGLPVLSDDLQHHASGCYSSVMEIKALNRRAEARLMDAEIYGQLAGQLGLDVLGEDLSTAWKNVLFNQFHDTMGGCSIREACEDAIRSYGESLSVADRYINRVQQAIAWNIDTSQGRPVNNSKYDFRLWEQDDRGVPITVFNPLAWPVRSVMRTGVSIESVRDSGGVPVPSQRLRSQVTNGREDKWESAFIADIPAMGYSTYWLYQKKQAVAELNGGLDCGDDFLENDWLRVEFERVTGRILKIFDKASGADLLSAPARALVMDETDSDTWSHGIFTFDKLVGEFSATGMEIVERGEVCATMRVKMRYGSSTITQKLTLYREKPGLYIEYLVGWNERHRMLKLSFPTPFAAGETLASIPYGFMEKPANGKDQPMQGWVAVRGGGRGLGIATDTRAAFSSEGGEVRITALRSPIYADHYGERDDMCEFTEQGEQRFTLCLLPVGEDTNALRRTAAEFIHVADRIVGAYHAGRLEQSCGGISVNADNVDVTVMKPAEDGRGIILRMHEAGGKSTAARVELPLLGACIDAELGAQKIVSYRIHDGRAGKVDLLEQPIE